MTGRGARVGRGVAAAAVATLLAALSHTLGGGSVPLGPGALLAFAFSALTCIALAGRNLSLLRLGASVVLSQLAFHALFVVSGGTAVAHSGHHLTAAGMTSELAAVPMPASPHLHNGVAMSIAHLCAAVLTIAALHRGERTLRALSSLLARAVGTLVRLPQLVPIAIARIRPDATLPLRGDVAPRLSSMRHRGPPVLLAFA
ncbi:hypothetical protein WDJ51_04415 [Rathayibacter sp. YIM 133350]|uniref:hypothetical protein n=1 Tax=Rathayibacter sp. YIM 133350 TaxID=3131992 RepID=UPI00307D8DA4